MKKLLVFVVLSAASLWMSAQQIWYVRQGATGNGTSWQSPSGDLQEMINQAYFHGGGQVWVAQGIYMPERDASNPFGGINPNSRRNSFVIHEGVEVYGGFWGYETQIEQRDWKANQTILSGLVTGTNRCFHVVAIVGVENVVLNGFYIRNGWADYVSVPLYNVINGDSIYDNIGGGIVVFDCADITLKNLIIEGNFADHGGGIDMQYSNDCLLQNIILRDNWVYEGGGMSMTESDPTLVNVLIYRNYANMVANPQKGAGLFVESSYPKLINVTIAGNVTDMVEDDDGVCIGSGRGIHCVNSLITLYNSIIDDEIEIGMLHGFPMVASLLNVVSYNSMVHSIYISHSNISGAPLVPGVPLLQTYYPMFIFSNGMVGPIEIEINNNPPLPPPAPLYPIAIQDISTYGTGTIVTATPPVPNFVSNPYPPVAAIPPDYHLQPVSQCIDAGYQIWVVPYTQIDLDGRIRVHGADVDMGVYEYGSPMADPPIVNQKSMGKEGSPSVLEQDAIGNTLSLFVYPNPTSKDGQTAIYLGDNSQYCEKSVEVKIYTMDGRLVYNQTFANGNIQTNFSNLSAGVYRLSLYTQDGECYNQKLLIYK